MASNTNTNTTANTAILLGHWTQQPAKGTAGVRYVWELMIIPGNRLVAVRGPGQAVSGYRGRVRGQLPESVPPQAVWTAGVPERTEIGGRYLEVAVHPANAWKASGWRAGSPYDAICRAADERAAVGRGAATAACWAADAASQAEVVRRLQWAGLAVRDVDGPVVRFMRLHSAPDHLVRMVWAWERSQA